MENDEKKYEDVIKSLKGLQQVKAPANFEADLQRRINAEIFSKEEKKSFWENVFVPVRLIPSLGLIAVSIVLFFVVENNPEEIDNPFLIQPRLREDVIKTANYEEMRSRTDELSKQKTLTKDAPPVVQEKKNEIDAKSSDDKMILDEGKSGQVDRGYVERDYDMQQNVAKSFEMVIPDSTAPTPPTSSLTAGAILSDSVNAEPKTINEKSALKEELNFRQVQLTEEEQKNVEKLKMQVQSLQKADKLK